MGIMHKKCVEFMNEEAVVSEDNVGRDSESIQCV